MNTCTLCQSNFPVDEQDLKFYEKMEVPAPTLCPPCRQRNRLVFRNEINFFRRKCDKTGKEILSMYEPGSPYKVYDHEEWWKDDWDAMKFGRDFDFNKTFFEQFKELQLEVPRMSLNNMASENSYYTNYSWRDKGCYLLSTADENEDCYYGRFSDRDMKCVDFDFTYDSRFCYQTLNVHKCQSCFYSQKLDSCSDNYFCYDMRNCHNCIFSANLRNQNYMIFNKKVTAEEFKKFKDELNLGSYAAVQAALARAQEFFVSQPRKYLENVQCEDAIGDYLKNCKNAKFCFDSYDLHDTAYSSICFKLKDSYDWDFVGDKSEFCYYMVSCASNIVHSKFCMNIWNDNSDVMYSDLCVGNENLFGCIGLRKKKYCILNKQYKKEEYKELIAKIVEHMKRTGEFGQFFPATMSPFAYNDSVANEYFPMSKEQVLAMGLRWRDPDEKEYQPQTVQIPDNIKDVPDNFIDALLACEDCRKNFKITVQELAYNKEFKIPIPHKCWICRHKTRMKMKNPRAIYQRRCAKCNAEIVTTYAPERPEPIYCEKCYLEFVS